MDIDIAAAAVGHHEAEALLVVEELDLALDHGSARTAALALAIAAAGAEAIAAAKAVAAAATAEAVTATPTTETVAAAKTATARIVAKIAARPARSRCLCGARIDAMNGDHLKSSRRVLKVANDRGARR